MRYIVFVPSNQDYNFYPDRSTEQRHMEQLADLCMDYCNGIPDLQAYVVGGAPSNSMRGLSALYSQLSHATSLLDELNADPRQSAIINLHSDSGTWRHVLGLYGGGVGSGSYNLAVTVSSQLEKLMLTGDLRFWDYSGYAFYSYRGKYNTCMIECGSHQNIDDLEFLIHRKPMMAEALVRGALAYLGGPVEKEAVSEPAAEYFSAWGIPCNQDSAIYKFWKLSYDAGDAFNLGPATSIELDGEPYGEAGNVVQKFVNSVIVSKPSEGWKCYKMDITKWIP